MKALSVCTRQEQHTEASSTAFDKVFTKLQVKPVFGTITVTTCVYIFPAVSAHLGLRVVLVEHLHINTEDLLSVGGEGFDA